MICPECGGKTTVCDTTEIKDTNEIYRQRKCLDCGNKFFTVEFEVERTDAVIDIWTKNHRVTKRDHERRMRREC